jgi:hypothetical protein
MGLAESGGLKLSELKFDRSNDGQKDNLEEHNPEWDREATEEELGNFFRDLQGIIDRKDNQ